MACRLRGASSQRAPWATCLRYQRDLRGWSQQDVAEELYRLCVQTGKAEVAVCADTVGRWERGVTKPAPVYRKHLCLLYGLTADRLGLM